MSDSEGETLVQPKVRDVRFKYQSFKSLVDQIKIDVVRRSRIVEENPDTHDSFFYESLLSWKELNLTRHFKNFAAEIAPLCRTLPSIIYHKDKIVNVIVQHLQVPDSLALDGILDLITKLAKDLEGEFYPYFPRILSTILPLSRRPDASVLQNLFNCVAYLFKYLSRQLIPDLCPTFDLMAKYFGEDQEAKSYIRHFSAEAFAFLMRKSRGKGLTEIVQHILTSLREDSSEAYVEGIAMLFFECLKQVDRQLHSRAEPIYKELLKQTLDGAGDLDLLELDPVQDMLLKTNLLTLRHAKRESFTPILNIVLGNIEAEMKETELRQSRVKILLSLLAMITTVDRAGRVSDWKPIVSQVQQVAKKLAETPALDDKLRFEILRVLDSVLTFGSLETYLSGGNLAVDYAMEFKNADIVYGFIHGLAQHDWSTNNFTQIMLQNAVSYATKNIAERPEQTVAFLAQLMSTGALNVGPGILNPVVTPEGLIRFAPEVPSKLLELLRLPRDWTLARDTLNAVDVFTNDSGEIPDIPLLSSILHILPHIAVSFDNAFESVLQLVDQMMNYLDSSAADNGVVRTPYVLARQNFVVESLLGLAVETLARLSHTHDGSGKLHVLHDNRLNQLLSKYGHNEVVLRGVLACLNVLRTSDDRTEIFTTDRLEAWYACLKNNLTSYHANCRLYTCKILALFEQPTMKTDENHSEEEACEIVQNAIDAEEAAADAKDFRDKLLYVRKIAQAQSSGRLPDLYKDFAGLYGLGLLTVNLLPLWDEAIKLLETFARANRGLFWDMCYKELLKFDDEKQLVLDGFASQVFGYLDAPPERNLDRPTRTGKIFFGDLTLAKYKVIKKVAMSAMQSKRATNSALFFSKLVGQPNARMDFWNYYTLILKALKGTPHIAEKKSQLLVPLFDKFLEAEVLPVLESSETQDSDAETMDVDSTNSQPSLGILEVPRKAMYQKLSAWLALFAAFTQPQRLQDSQHLYDIFLRMLLWNDQKVQSQALECVLAWRDPKVRPYGDRLRNLLDPNRFSDQLLAFTTTQEDQSDIDPAHRDHVMPIIMRILYGRIHQKSRKKSTNVTTIYSAITSCQPEEIQMFMDIILEPFRAILELDGETKGEEGQIVSFEFAKVWRSAFANVPLGRGYRFLKIVDGLLKAMATHIVPYIQPIMKVILYLIYYTQMAIDNEKSDKELKEMRSEASKLLVEIFRSTGDADFKAYIPAIYSSLISPRLASLAQDSAQHPTAILNLFANWASQRTRIVYLVDYDDRVLPELYNLLSVKKIDRDVLSIILGIIESIMDVCDTEMETDEVLLKDRILMPYVENMLQSLKYRLTESRDDATFRSSQTSVRQVAIVSRLAPYAKDGEQATAILDVLLPSLKKSERNMSEEIKGHVIAIWAKMIRILPGFEKDSHVYNRHYGILSSLLSSMRSLKCRLQLLQVFKAFAEVNPDLETVYNLLENMNKIVEKRKVEPDYDSLLDTLNTIADNYIDSFNHHQWLPVLNQLVHNMHELQEMAVRGSATHCVVLYIRMVGKKDESDEEKRKLFNHIEHIIYVSIKQGLTNDAEVVRMEFVSTLHECVKVFPSSPLFEDMVCLLGDGSEESSFFDNIYHLQTHCRMKALSQLAQVTSEGKLRTRSLTSIFMPIVSASFFELDKKADHALINECILTITEIARQLPWGNYYRIFVTYMDLINRKPHMTKSLIRIIIGILDAFHFDLSSVQVAEDAKAAIVADERVKIEYKTSEEITTMEVDEEVDQVDTSSRNQAEKIHDMVVERMLPSLNKLLNKSDTRNGVLVRAPLAIGVTKLLLALPEQTTRLNVPGLLVKVCHAIRSRAQDVRNTIRETLLKINRLLGPSYFSFIIKELRTTLTKGYELHVLGYTVDSLVQDTIPRVQVGELDPYLDDIVQVLMNDLFGVTGQEKESDEMIAKTKEAKASKSPGTFEALAQIIEFKNVTQLLLPLKDVIANTDSLKTLRKAEQILHRIAAGLVRNPGFDSVELLDFAHALITENLDSFKAKKKAKVEKSQMEMNYEVQPKRRLGEEVDHYNANVHLFVNFGLSLLYTALKRYRQEARGDMWTGKLDAYVYLMRDTMYSKNVANVALACRISSVLVTLPLPSVPKAVPDLTKRVIQLIKNSGNTQSQMVQACMRLLTVLVREKESSLSNHQLKVILDIIRPDLEEPEKQSAAFGLLRAFVSRKFMTDELEEMMDVIAEFVVTNHTEPIRNQARSTFFMFLVDCPQEKGKLKKRISFVLKNLEYVYETGRQSVMELLLQIIRSFGDELLMEFAEQIFLALVMRLINDESAKCREMAGELIKLLLQRCDEHKLSILTRLLDTWLGQTSKPAIQRASIQVYGLFLDAYGEEAKSQADKLASQISTLIKGQDTQADKRQGQDMDVDSDIQWEIVYYALSTFGKIIKTFPSIGYSAHVEPLWQQTEELLLYPHAWVRMSASRLFGQYFGDIKPEERNDYLDRQKLRALASHFIEQLKSEHLNEEHSTQLVRNLFFIAKCFYFMGQEDNDEQEKQKPSLPWLIKGLSYLGRGAIQEGEQSYLMRTSIFKLFAAIANFIPAEKANLYLENVVSTIYRSIDDKNHKGGKLEQLKQLGNEVFKMLENKLGSTFFVTYHQVRRDIEQTREKRKAERLEEEENNPEKAAQRKLKKRVKEQAAKKNKKARIM